MDKIDSKELIEIKNEIKIMNKLNKDLNEHRSKLSKKLENMVKNNFDLIIENIKSMSIFWNEYSYDITCVIEETNIKEILEILSNAGEELCKGYFGWEYFTVKIEENIYFKVYNGIVELELSKEKIKEFTEKNTHIKFESVDGTPGRFILEEIERKFGGE